VDHTLWWVMHNRLASTFTVLFIDIYLISMLSYIMPVTNCRKSHTSSQLHISQLTKLKLHFVIQEVNAGLWTRFQMQKVEQFTPFVEGGWPLFVIMTSILETHAFLNSLLNVRCTFTYLGLERKGLIIKMGI